MGEAKRRRRTGTRNARPKVAETVRTPPGHVTVSVDAGEPGPIVMLMLPLAEVDTAVNKFAAALLPGVSYREVVLAAREEAMRAQKSGAEYYRGGYGLAAACLWLVFNHPSAGPQLRAGVSTVIRRNDAVHVSVQLDARGMMVAVNDHYVPGGALLEEAVRAGVSHLAGVPEDDGGTLN